MNTLDKIFTVLLVTLVLASVVLYGCSTTIPVEPDVPQEKVELNKFKSGEDLLEVLKSARGGDRILLQKSFDGAVDVIEAAVASDSVSGTSASVPEVSRDFSETNVQVQGVDEADIIKTDGDYIYTISQGNLVIVRAYPADKAEILSTTNIENFNPRELFIHNDKLLVFGSTNYNFEEQVGEPISEIIRSRSYPRYVSVMSVRLYDISDKGDPEFLKTFDFEGSYITSRKIGSDVYFVVNSYPRYYEDVVCEDVLPLYRESTTEDKPGRTEFDSIVGCTDVGYIKPVQARNFITVASVSMTNKYDEVNKEVILGNGQNVYASLENLYVAQSVRRSYVGELAQDGSQKTVITKFELDDGEIEFIGTGEVKGRILNQFSMDEYKGDFRIATTIDAYSNNKDESTNNMYVLDEDLELTGSLEGIAPGEKIYSVRFMGKRGYMVTFRHVDPLFVIDLSDSYNPEILGKLKIPGYSDYLHPYDETHLIGIGKEVDASIDADKVHTEGAVYYTAIQGVKLAIFDVSDVSNPVEMYKEVIGDRGTESLATQDHKAFLFDKDKEILIVPMTVAELKEGQDKSNQGDYTFQGAYVYDLNLKDGFDLRGRVSHYDEDDEAFKKSGYYFRGDKQIKRSLYINNVLYTLSDSILQLNDLNDLDKLNVLEFEGVSNNYPEELRVGMLA